MPKAAAHSTQAVARFHKDERTSSQMRNFLSAHEDGDPVIALWQNARRRHYQMDTAYHHLSAVLRALPRDELAIGEAQTRADALGQRYEQTCDEVCKTPATSLKGLLAKLECATRCIRDIVPEGEDPEQVCDIELRFVFAVERDVRRLIADTRRRIKRAGHRAKRKRREKTIATSLREVGSR